MDMAFEEIDGCKSIIDDMLVWGSFKEEHDQNLRKVLERDQVECRQMCIWSNRSELFWPCAIQQRNSARP